MNPGIFIALGATAVAGIGGFALFQWTKRHRDRRAAHQEALLAPLTPIHPDKGIPRPWVIVNPSKFDDLDSFKATVEAAAAEHGVTHVHWRETSVEDPGTGQAAQAVADGASVVLAAGGDGTVRAVAAGLAGTGVRMGVLPCGTGNLFARNLHLPVDDVAKAVHVALGKGHRAIDLCWMRVDDIEEPAPSTPEGALLLAARGTDWENPETPAVPQDSGFVAPRPDEHAFLVVAGMGFDGRTMVETDSSLKKSIGWAAYVVAAMGALDEASMKAGLTLHGPRNAADQRSFNWDGAGSHTAGVIAQDSGRAEGAARQKAAAPSSADNSKIADESVDLTARSILFANCGELPFVTLAPDAALDDGLVDVIAVDTQVGAVGWANLASKIFAQGLGIRPINLPTSTAQIAFRQARGASVRLESAQVIQVDGDPLGTARQVYTRIQAGALDVSVPQR